MYAIIGSGLIENKQVKKDDVSYHEKIKVTPEGETILKKWTTHDNASLKDSNAPGEVVKQLSGENSFTKQNQSEKNSSKFVFNNSNINVGSMGNNMKIKSMTMKSNGEYDIVYFD
jgi:hypothetical protein